MADDIHINLEGDDPSGGGSNEQYEDLARRMEELTEAMERARRSAQASQQRRDRLGRFSTDPNSARQRRRSGAGSGASGGGSGGSGGSGGGSGQPGPASRRSGNRDSFFRIEGLFNLLKGGSNIRIRGIQNFTLQQVKDLFQRLQAQAIAAQRTGGQGGIGNRMLATGYRAVSKLGSIAKNVGSALLRFIGTPIGMATAAVAGLGVAAALVGVALNRLRRRLDQFAQRLTGDLRGVSPAIALAQAQANVNDMLSRIESNQRIGGALGTQTQLNQELKEAMRELNTTLFSLIAPLLRGLTRLATMVVDAVNAAVDGINKGIEITLKLAEWIPGFKKAIDRMRELAEEKERREREEQVKSARNMKDTIIKRLRESANTALK